MTRFEGSAPAPAWLTTRPIAHRGLHDRAQGVIENSLSAARDAIAAGFAIECDVQLTADGEAVVFHDEGLQRLTGADGLVRDREAEDLGHLRLLGSADSIPTFPEFLSAIAGQVPLICEIKSLFDGDLRLTRRVAAVARTYEGPLALKSFDPVVVAALRNDADLRLPGVPLGIVAEALYADVDWAPLGEERKRELAALAHLPHIAILTHV